jgi:hypothetical protein
VLTPLEFDKAIEESNSLRANEAFTDLGECIDYSLEK